jgi:hypothetical protein
MDAFEQVVSEMLWMDGFWVQTSVKVNLTPKEKEIVGKRTMPRPELDIVAYRGRDNLLYVVECKSYLNSRGVTFAGLSGADAVTAGRYKLFSDAKPKLREVVLNRLRAQLTESGACPSIPASNVRLCLACGHIASKDNRSKLRKHFEDRKWELWDEDWLREHLKKMAKSKYENQISHVVAKLCGTIAD